MCHGCLRDSSPQVGFRVVPQSAVRFLQQVPGPDFILISSLAVAGRAVAGLQCHDPRVWFGVGALCSSIGFIGCSTC